MRENTILGCSFGEHQTAGHVPTGVAASERWVALLQVRDCGKRNVHRWNELELSWPVCHSARKTCNFARKTVS